MAKSRSRTRYSRKSSTKKGAKKKKTLPIKKKQVKLNNAVPAVCSECYGDFLISTTPSDNNITCPSCGHVGIAEKDCFQAIGEERSQHKTNFIVALCVNIAALLCVMSWGLFNSWPFASVNAKGTTDGLGETTNMVVLGAGVVLLLVGFFLVHKYEKNRVEVYF